MKDDSKITIEKVVDKIWGNYKNEDLFLNRSEIVLPNRKNIINILGELRQLIFPSFFVEEDVDTDLAKYFIGQKITSISVQLKKEIARSLNCSQKQCSVENMDMADKIVEEIIEELPEIQKIIIKDIEAAFQGDPAAGSKEQVVFSYPGIYAVFVYRIANLLYKRNVPLIPRIMTEYAHSRTGIDINAGATIGEYFFIDHGTGVVIGETTVIGDNVKLFQGVTLGALSTRGGQSLSGVKRHPTLEDGVVVYSGATILGGETIIGKGSIIGGNAFITESIAPNTKVKIKKPEMTIIEG